MFLARNGPGARRRKESFSRTERCHPLGLVAESLLARAPERGELFQHAPSRHSVLRHRRPRRRLERRTAADPAHKILDFGHNLANWRPKPGLSPAPFS